MTVYIAMPVVGISGFCWSGFFFLRFASLCGVFPLNVIRGIVRSLLVISTFVLGGGGGDSVTIGQCMSIWMGCIGIRV